MENIVFDIKFNNESYQVYQSKQDGALSYVLPIYGNEDFYNLIDIINEYNPSNSILHKPWEDEEEEMLICDRILKYNDYNINYRVECDTVTDYIKIYFNTNNDKKCEEFIRRYVSILVYNMLIKKNELEDKGKEENVHTKH